MLFYKKISELFWELKKVFSSGFLLLLGSIYFSILLFPVIGIDSTAWLEYKIYDFRHFIAGKFRQADPSVKIVGIDMRALSESGQRWPWSRKKMGDVIERISQMKPKALVVDVLFQNPESEETDKYLAEKLASFDNVFLISILEEKTGFTGTSISRFSSLEIFRKNSKEGFVWGIPSSDGRIREFRIFDPRLNSESCALKVFHHLKGNEKSTIFPQTAPLIFATSGGRIPILSLNQIYSGDPSVQNFLNGKIVVLGVTARAVHDFHQTPIGTISGAEILAASIDTLISERIGTLYFSSFWARFLSGLIGFLLAAACLLTGIPTFFTFFGALAFFVLVQIGSEVFLLFPPNIPFLVSWFITIIALVGVENFVTMIVLQKMQLEADNARIVQEQILPAKGLEFKGFKIAGAQKTADELGGDYFDYFVIKDRFIVVFTGDATGHGMPAALAVAVVKASVLSALSFDLKLADIASHVSKTLFLALRRRLMMTAALVMIDTETGEFQYQNCGHPYPYKIGLDGQIEELKAYGISLGMREEYRQGKPFNGRLEPGERLLFYTDGLVESLDEDKRVNAFDLFRDYLLTLPRMEIEENCREIIRRHPFFIRKVSQPDDFTVVLIEKVPTS